MADTRFGERERELDWDNLSAPVPMDLIDPEFPAHPPENLPGAASQALPREESEALAREAGAGPSEFPGADPALRDPNADATEIMPPTPPDPRATVFGTTLFGGTDALQDEFARIRAEVEAEAEAEKQRKQEAEKEEAAQRARLEQWMANARARLLKADADLTGPAGRVRLRKDTSPSLYRLAEMQKTMHIDGDATRPDATGMVPRQAPPDPMATISVPADQFYGPGPVSSDPPGRLAQVFPPPADPAPVPPTPQVPVAPAPPAAPELNIFGVPVTAVPPASAPRVERSFAFPPRSTDDPPYESGPIPLVPSGDDFHPMSREEALTRKVAKIRMAAEKGENTLVLAPSPEGDGEGRALNFAIAAVVLIAVLVLGLGLFAATQAGLFDGLENRIPFLKPKMANLTRPMHVSPPPAPAVSATAPVPRPPAPGPSSAANRPASASATPAPAPLPSEPRAAAAPSAPAVRPQARPADRRPAPSPRSNAVTPDGAVPANAAPARTDPGRAPRAVPSPANNRKPAAAAPAEDDGIPAYARPPAKAGNMSEIILRNSIEAATNIDKDNLLDLYNRYALGFPGLSGEVVIGLTVDPSGRILEGYIASSTTGVEGFDQELLRKVLDWRLRSFPESRPRFLTAPFLFPMQGR